MLPTGTVTFLFTDIEGSSRLWETLPDQMRPALALHDGISRAAVEGTGGSIVKSTGDGIHAVFSDPLQAIVAGVNLLVMLEDPASTAGVPFKVRCGIHTGVNEQRDGDFFGSAVNKAARIMGAAHGGQALVSQVVAELVSGLLPNEIALMESGKVRLRDIAQPERVFQIIHPRLRREFPALRSLEATPHNLPLQMTRFIGREHEIAEARDLLDRARLVTLFGMGGLGKTRLSLQIAATMMDEYPDGIWFVQLAPLADARLVTQAVASVLGVKEEPGSTLIDALVRHVAGRRMLLILDNCEHLLEACATLSHRLLQAGPKTAIIATSRERLNVAGEQICAIHSLPAPGAGAGSETVDALPRFEAVRLFLDRASAARPDFRLTPENAQAVAAICRTLEGIPLAIELAAARARTLSVQHIAARLSDRLRLLTSGVRDALPHHQTLRASIDWSHDLLSPQERALFRRLSIFAGGWTVEAAEEVAADETLPTSDILDRMSDLVDKSLVILEAPSGRYRMLDTVRQYAREQLAGHGESETNRSRHLAYYLRMLDEVYEKLYGPEQGEWLPRLDAERENLLAAHAACDHAEHGVELGLELAFRTKPYWIDQGLLGLGYRVTHEALDRKGVQPRAARGRGLSVLGELCSFMGRYTEALEYLEESLAIARELSDSGMAAADLNTLCTASLGCGDLERARRYASEGLVVARELGEKRKIAAMLVSLAQLNRSEGALDIAEPQYAEALALTRELEDRVSVAVVLLNLAMLAISRNAMPQARAALREAIEIIDDIQSNRLGQSALDVAAGLASTVGDWALSARLYGAVNAEMAATALQREPADEAFLLPLLEKAREAMGNGSFAESVAAGVAQGYREALNESRRWLDAAN